MADDAPNAADLRFDDHEYNPAVEPNKARAWLNLLEESEQAFEDWNTHCDNLDRLYANLERLSIAVSGRMIRDKEYQIFWANAEVIKPAIYANPPVPVVVPKFKDRRPVYQQASEVMERCCIVAFDLTRINDLMLLVRDDVALIGRGVAWCRYESAAEGYYDTERVCVDFKARRDFLHSISRNWREVNWVAAASYLTRVEARNRFHKYSGDAYREADYKVDREGKEVGGADDRERAKFWEIWDKGSRRVVWVADGVEDILDEDNAHLELQNFFPCPKPAYATVQRGSLIPVPDVMQYRDQLDEINLLTGRIHALSECLEAKGFYPAGGTELADAVQAAIKTHTAGRVLVPIANWAAFGGTNTIIEWLPIDQIATTIQALVMLRKQIIDDIYQITGMSDIMRGDTDPNETLGAQQMKSQYGTTRIRDKQQELVRLARDVVEITSEIITEKFKDDTIIEMSQTQLPTTADVQQAIQQIQQKLHGITTQMQQLVNSPQGQQIAQQSPDQAQQIQQQTQAQVQQGVQQIQQLQDQPTIDQVLELLRNSRVKSFVLDIETDSTIMADENAEKQRRTEFVGVLAQLLPQLSQMIVAQPQTASFCGEVLKFATAPFRAGRSLDGAIDDLVEQMKQKGSQPQPTDPATMASQTQLQIEQMKITYAREKDTADRQVKVQQIQSDQQAGLAKAQTEAQTAGAEIQSRQQEAFAKSNQINMQAANQQREHDADMQEMFANHQLDVQKHQATMQAQAAKQQQAAQQSAARQQANQMRALQPRGRPI